MIELKAYAAVTDQGPYLQINEDLVDIDLKNNLFILLDGFGGSNVGDKASILIRDTVKKFYTRFGEDPEATLPFFYSPQFLLEGNALINCAKYAHEVLMKENIEKEMNNRGGASGAIVSQSENILNIFSTGNCSVYLYSKGKSKRLVNPKNFEYLGLDHFDRSFQTFPTCAFGLYQDLYYELTEVKVRDGDQLIVLSDGAYGRISTNELDHIMKEKKISLKEYADEIFSLNNSRGNLDNQSCIILSY
ncbi:hypothetical protein OAT67_05600 [Bacteriovoracaceae bacterium]|nr:hypothetical protein [Bacteriovoracaceae bacterium]|tara:strand:+ start:51785 stop:52525 length:741 start_codon:yes stop_codon:yes gene_type:complete